MSAQGWLARRRPRKLKFRDGTGARTAPHLLAVIEALPFEITGRDLTTCDGRHRLTLDRPLEGHRLRTDDGHDIPCLDLHYVSLLKRGKGAPKDDLDRSVLREWRQEAAGPAVR